MIKIYNTLSAKKENLIPRKGKKINMFVCGPTVYDYTHIGHIRSFLFYDVFAKYLKSLKYNVYYLQNITDIDDKIISRAKEKGVSPLALALSFEKEYLRDIKLLKINSVKKYARATKHIKEIISQIERLFKKGFAYKASDGIYYDIKKFKSYGRLSKRTAIGAEDAVSRIDEAEEKKNKGDFCLWKFSKPEEPKWKSPWGYGRPGWHIEDTAISEKYFGFQYDIHGGGRDLIFPHHEAEIAQMEALSGKSPMAKYWVHTGFLTVNGNKMSKSLNNFIVVKYFTTQNSPRLLRYFFLKSHYRSSIDYNEENIYQAKKELEKIDEFINKIKNKKSKSKSASKNLKIIKRIEKEFYKAMDDDINTPVATACIFQLINEINKNETSEKELKEIINFLKKIDNFLNFIFWPEKKKQIPKTIKDLAKEREKARKEKNFEKADELRKKIEDMGYKIEDTEKGTALKLIK